MRRNRPNVASVRAALRTLFENSPDGVLVVDGDNRIVEANVRATALLGLTPDTVVGKRFQDLISPQRRRRTPLAATTGRESARPAFVRAKRADRSHADLLVQDIPCGVGGMIIRILNDGNASNSLTATLARKTRLLEEAERVGRMGVWEVDLKAGVMLRTPELCRIMEIPTSHHTTPLEASYDSYTEWSRAIVREAFTATLERGTPYDLEVEVVTGRGKRMWTREVCRTTMEKGRILSVIGVTQDITERRQLGDLLADIANRERARIGADLHDGLGQELTGLALLLRSLAKRSDSAGPGLTLELNELADLASRAVATARDMAHGMLPVDLGDGGFAGALQRLARSTGASFGVIVSVRFGGDKQYAPDGTVAEHLYRIAQEAIANGAKHGHPKRITLLAQFSETQTVLTISNDGERIELGRVSGGMGLQIMRHRARTLGGLLQVQPMPSRGTRVRCVVPRTGAG